MIKIDYKKEMKGFFKPSHKEVSVIELPSMQFLMIDGQGDPKNSQTYQDATEALYAVSYNIKFMCKKELEKDYTVPPLEGLWWTDNLEQLEDRSQWQWTSMIMQPEFVNQDIYERACAAVKKKKDPAALPLLRFETRAEGKAAQIMHVGPYSEEQPTIHKLHSYIQAEGFSFNGKHHEIYLGDPRRTAPEKLQTIIRQPIA